MCMWCSCVCRCVCMCVCVICACGMLEECVCMCAYVHVVCVCGYACMHEQVPSLHTNCSLSLETVSLTESEGHRLARLDGQVAEHSLLLPPSTGIPGKHSLGQFFMQSWPFELRSSCMPCQPTEPRSLPLECICIWLHRHKPLHLCCNCTKIALNCGFVIWLGEFAESVNSMWPCLVRITTAGAEPLW